MNQKHLQTNPLNPTCPPQLVERRRKKLNTCHSNGTTTTISVVIPAYNSGSTIAETLDSLFVQDYPVSEIIVVDDLSTDNTVEVVKRWHLNHAKAPLVLVAQPENRGPAGARNAGIARATGEWVAFVDSDDTWLSDKTTNQMAQVSKDPDATLVCGRVISLNDNIPSTQNAIGSLRVFALLDFVEHNPIATSTVMVKRDALISLSGFDESFCGPEDYDLWLRMVSKFKCIDLDIPLSRYRFTVGSLSMDERKFLPQVLNVLKKAFGDGGALYTHQKCRRRAYSSQYSSASWMAYNRGANGRALRLLIISWWYDIRRLPKEHDDPMLRLKLLIRYLLHRKPDVHAE